VHPLQHRALASRKQSIPDYERQVKRGLIRPGQNPTARVFNFYECRGQFFKQARCPLSEICQGGCYRGRILDFCYQDDDCFLRLVELQAACTAAQREAETMESVRERPDVQASATEEWRKAYNDWTSAYENHRDCPDRRYASEIFRLLKRADVVQYQRYIPDDSRLGAHPRSLLWGSRGITMRRGGGFDSHMRSGGGMADWL
jgi:hypothetical protein